MQTCLVDCHSLRHQPKFQYWVRLRILLLDMLNFLPVTSEHIRQWTSKDPVLSIKSKSWYSRVGRIPKTQTLPPTRGVRKDELSVHNGCLLWGTRVVVPPPGRDKITRALHKGHPGITRMKALARSLACVVAPKLTRTCIRGRTC